jgi:hypothetical protein
MVDDLESTFDAKMPAIKKKPIGIATGEIHGHINDNTNKNVMDNDNISLSKNPVNSNDIILQKLCYEVIEDLENQPHLFLQKKMTKTKT